MYQRPRTFNCHLATFSVDCEPASERCVSATTSLAGDTCAKASTLENEGSVNTLTNGPTIPSRFQMCA